MPHDQTAANTFPRGSEWRKWDLQVHTPFSILNNGFGSDFELYAKRLLTEAVEKDIAAIGVTDYFSIDGYRHLRGLLQDEKRLEQLVGEDIADRAKQILVLPNVELRSTVVVRNSDGRDSRVNFHVLFSDALTVDEIEEHFFRELRFTAESGPGQFDEKWLLTRSNLEALGKRLKEQQDTFRDKSDLYIGMKTAIVSHESVTEVLEGQSRFKDKYLIIVPADEDLSKVKWDGQGHLVRKLMLQKAHMLFAGNPNTRDFALGHFHESRTEYLQEFKSRKPCIHSSDAHSYDRLFKPDMDRFTWIKANPTFDGLRQLLSEPESRVFIGLEPPSVTRVRNNRTRYMTKVEFVKTEKTPDEQRWFGGSLSLNTGLVAVIGNKGSGKSALADTLALLGNIPSNEDFSFLNKKRFLSPRDRFGSMFEAQVTWESGMKIKRKLDEQPTIGDTPLVKYLPQSYIEKVCSDVQQQSAFDDELMKVVFSHVDKASRLGRESLRELIEFKTEETNRRIDQYLKTMGIINSDICRLEGMLTPEYQAGVKSKYDLKRAELSAHDGIKPKEVAMPEKDPETQEAVATLTRNIERIQAKKEILNGKQETATTDFETLVSKIAVADKLLARIRNLKNAYETFLEESRHDADELTVNLSKVVSLHIDLEPIQRAKLTAERERERLTEYLDDGSENSYLKELQQLEEQEEMLQSQLDEPNQEYQAYLRALQGWEEKRKEIIGSPEVSDSLLGLQDALDSLKEIPKKISDLKVDRNALMTQIFEAKIELLETYRDLYRPVQEYIDRESFSNHYRGIHVEASIDASKVVEGFLAMINQGRAGSFNGSKDGRERLDSLVSGAQFDSPESTLHFAQLIVDHLQHDRRHDDGDDRDMLIEDQLKQNVSRKQVYDYLFGLEYLQPRFELQWEGKTLDQLSPGERGIMLLIFYLLVDRDQTPLIIDQPEENLDNQTIAQVLVPAIKQAKERRQIIMVTHNPNLAVVCDADQVIHAVIDKTDGNRITYSSGSLEDPNITQAIVDILEGTKPAFDHRDAQYGILEVATTV